MNSESLVVDHPCDGRLVALKPDQPLDVPLFWQQSRIVSPVLGHVTRAVMHEARTVLAPL
jgi:LysR family transcriptional regulator (chromosome initiation inhibitor)